MTTVLPAGPSDTTDPTAPGTHRAPETGAPPGRTHRTTALLAAVSVPLGGVLMLASTFVDPRSPAGVDPHLGMFVAYGADRAGADVAATLLHWGMLLFGVGLFVAALAVATRRGRGIALTGGILSAVGFANMSGMVFSDWYDASLAATFGPQKAMELADAAVDMPALTAGWVIPAFVGCAVGPLVALVGLARGRAVSWWVLALPVLLVATIAGGPVLGDLAFQAALGVAIVLGAVVGAQLLARAEGEPA